MWWQLLHIWKGSPSSQYQMILFWSDVSKSSWASGWLGVACTSLSALHLRAVWIAACVYLREGSFLSVGCRCLGFSWPRCNHTGAVGALEGLPFTLHFLPLPVTRSSLIYPFSEESSKPFLVQYFVSFTHIHYISWGIFSIYTQEFIICISTYQIFFSFLLVLCHLHTMHCDLMRPLPWHLLEPPPSSPPALCPSPCFKLIKSNFVWPSAGVWLTYQKSPDTNCQ